jgi:hypothetical protein
VKGDGEVGRGPEASEEDRQHLAGCPELAQRRVR